MNLAAQRLVAEDSRASHGLVPEESIIDEERELESIYAERRQSEDSKDAPMSDAESPSRPFPTSSATSLPNKQFFAFGTRRRPIGSVPSSTRGSKGRNRVFWINVCINVALIASWYFFSTLISVYNKWMFSPEHYNFGFPLFVTSFHMIMQFCLSGVVLLLAPGLRSNSRPDIQDYLTKAGPCGLATGLDIGLSNLSLKSITLSFYTMCKSSSLGFVLLFAFLFGLERPTWRLVGIIALITVGVILMVSAETRFSLVGMVEVLTASAMGGLRWSLTQLLLDRQAMGFTNPITTLFWLAPIMAAVLGVCSVIFEGPLHIFGAEEFFGNIGLGLRTMGLILFPGSLAFCMTISEFMLISRTSVVTLSVAGIFKEVATIFLSTTIFHDELTPINISGLCVSLFGIALYNYLKYREYDPNVVQHSEHRGHLQNGHALAQVDTEGEMALNARDSLTVDRQHSRPPFYNLSTESSLFVAGSAEYDISRDEQQHELGSESEEEDDGTDRDDIITPHVRLLSRKSAEEHQIDHLDQFLREDPGLRALAQKQERLEEALDQRLANDDDWRLYDNEKQK